MTGSQTQIQETLEQLVNPIVEDFGLELADLEFKPEGRSMALRIFIDKPGGVTLDDCVAVSREVGAVLEVEDPIRSAYRLEVSSPGLDRPLKKPADYEKFTGRLAKIKTRVALDPDGRGRERKTFTGRLLDIQAGRVRLELNDKQGGIAELPLDEIIKANLEIEL